jgi:outer membrane protein
MKPVIKYLLLSVLIAIISYAHGQTEKGNLFIGHQNLMELKFVKNIYLTNSESEEKTTEYTFTPIFGYFLARGLAVGIVPSYSYINEQNIVYVYSSKTNTLSVTPFIRYYIGNKKFKPFVDGGIGYKDFKTKYTNDNFLPEYSYSGNMVTYNLGAGISYFLKENISIDLGINYRYSRFTGKLWISEDDPNNADEDTKDKELNSYLSLVFYFHSKKAN